MIRILKEEIRKEVWWRRAKQVGEREEDEERERKDDDVGVYLEKIAISENQKGREVESIVVVLSWF